MKSRQIVEDLLRLINRRIEPLESSPTEPSRHFAAAGLLRCTVLCRAICVLDDADLGRVGALLARQLWETWLVSLHALLRGDDALREFAGDDIHWKRTLSKRLKLGLAYHDDWDGEVCKLNYQKLAEDIRPLLIQAGEAGDPSGVVGYDVTYRVHSLFSVHANLSTILRHVSYGEESWSLLANPPAEFGPPYEVPALHTAHLAQYVFRAFGIPTDQLEQISDALFAEVRRPAEAVTS